MLLVIDVGNTNYVFFYEGKHFPFMAPSSRVAEIRALQVFAKAALAAARAVSKFLCDAGEAAKQAADAGEFGAPNYWAGEGIGKVAQEAAEATPEFDALVAARESAKEAFRIACGGRLPPVAARGLIRARLVGETAGDRAAPACDEVAGWLKEIDDLLSFSTNGGGRPLRMLSAEEWAEVEAAWLLATRVQRARSFWGGVANTVTGTTPQGYAGVAKTEDGWCPVWKANDSVPSVIIPPLARVTHISHHAMERWAERWPSIAFPGTETLREWAERAVPSIDGKTLYLSEGPALVMDGGLVVTVLCRR